MALAAPAVKEWLAASFPGESTLGIARLAGIKGGVLSQQLHSGKVSEATVIAVARSLGLSPVRELSRFEPYRDLAAGPPPAKEVLAFIDWPHLLVAVGHVQTGRDFSERSLGEHLFPDSSRVWVESIDAGALRKRVEQDLGLASSNVAASLRRTLNLPLALAFAKHAGTPVASAFVVSGLLTPQEAGWDREERRNALLALDMVDLLKTANLRTVLAEKNLRRTRQLENRTASIPR